MRPKMQLSVQGGTSHALSPVQLGALQDIVGGLGADQFPLFLRLGGTERTRMQPVTARALLNEFERFAKPLGLFLVAGLAFYDATGAELGSLYSHTRNHTLSVGADTTLSPTPHGIRIVLKGFPPPTGFRSAPGLDRLHYECYFDELRFEGQAWLGLRTEEMGGSGAPVPLPALTLPPVTKWDVARVAGRPTIAKVMHVLTPGDQIYKDLIHAFVSACEESLRLKAPLEFRRD